jgi:hypothetical protein
MTRLLITGLVLLMFGCASTSTVKPCDCVAESVSAERASYEAARTALVEYHRSDDCYVKCTGCDGVWRNCIDKIERKAAAVAEHCRSTGGTSCDAEAKKFASTMLRACYEHELRCTQACYAKAVAGAQCTAPKYRTLTMTNSTDQTVRVHAGSTPDCSAPRVFDLPAAQSIALPIREDCAYGVIAAGTSQSDQAQTNDCPNRGDHRVTIARDGATLVLRSECP